MGWRRGMPGRKFGRRSLKPPVVVIRCGPVKAFGIESNTQLTSQPPSEILVFPMDRREEASKNTRRGMFCYPPMATRHPTYSDEADGDQDTGATAAEVVGECHIVIPDSQPTDPDEDSHAENKMVQQHWRKKRLLFHLLQSITIKDLATGGRTDKRSGVKRSRNSSSRSFPWSDMSLNERMSRCREVWEIETLVGQPLPDTLACIRGCIADVSITSRRQSIVYFEEDALLEVPAELRNVSWQDDAEFVAGLAQLVSGHPRRLKPLAPHLRATFQSKEAGVLVYSNEDERIDLRFGLEDVLATYLTKRKLIWSVDHRYNAFWCSHVVAWVRESFSIIEDFCAGVSRDDIVYAGEGILSTNRLIVWASGRMCTTARCAGLLTKVSESGMICPCVMDADTKEPCRVRIHQAVGMIKYGVNRKTLGSEWYEREGVTLDHMARDTAYFGIFQLMAATWEEQCLNKTCLQDIAPEKFQPLEELQHDAATKAAILENGEKGWKQCRVRVDSYAGADLAECRRNKETVVTGLFDHVQNDPTDASLVQMLTMSENTAKDVGLPVKARLLLPGCDDGGLSENRRYIDVSEGDKTSMALKIQEHFKSPGFEGDVIAERICSLSVKTIVCCWFGNRRGVHRDYNKHVIVDEAESLESYTKCRECIYKIWHTSVESNNATEYITSQAQMKARILHITGAPGIPDHFFESAWIFNAHPKYRREVFKTLGNGAVVDVTLIFDASPDRAFTEYTIKNLIDNESGTVSGYIGVVNFVLSRPTPMEGTWMKNKHAWYLEIHKALDVKGDENTKKKYLFNRFEITNKAVDIARLRTRKTYTVQFPEKPHLNSGTCDRKEMEEVLRKTVHNEITYDMIVSLVNQGSEAKVREDIRKAFTQSRVTIGGFQRKKASNNTTKEWRYPSYFVMSKQWCEEHQSSFEIMQQDVAIEKANSSALAVDRIEEGLRSGDFKMLHFHNGKERNKFLDDYFPDLTRWFSTSARLVRETTNSYLLSDDMKDCPVKCFISGHDKPERPDVIIKSRAFVVKYQANSQEVFKEAIKIFLKEKVSEEESLVSSSPSPVLEVLRDSSGKPWYDPSHENEEGVPFVFRRVEGPEEACNDPNAKKSYNLQNKNLSKGEEEEFECYFVLVAQKI
eukprot:jgi/Picre1/35173/NNA_002635.t1